MSASFRRIDYSLRPAKHAERRMLNEIFRRLRPFHPVEDYSYFGLGSLWFSDFALFHRTLGIRHMQSMERVETAEVRFEANKPFAAIETHYKDSSKVLPDLDWESRPAFVWLDYDNPIDSGMLLDVQVVVNNAISGSIIAVTVQCHRSPDIDDAQQDEYGPPAVVRFVDRIGADAVPDGTGEDDLMGWPFGALSRKIFADKIQATLAVRNLRATAGKSFLYMPICEIEYLDGAKMTTFVGILSEEADRDKLVQCKFDSLDFLTPDGSPIFIEIPVLTMREIREIEQQLPNELPLVCGAIPPGDAEKFAKFYRYLPNFAVLER